ncbi:MAG: NUDIX domain-containing protein, partial [Thermoproteota archaeon]
PYPSPRNFQQGNHLRFKTQKRLIPILTDGVPMWKKVSSQLQYSSSHLQVREDQVELPTGSQISFSTLDLPDFATVLPLTSHHIIMIRNYRYPAKKWFLELPSGTLNEGETPLQGAQRELQEETGYQGRFSSITWYHPISRSHQKAHIFLATHLQKGDPCRDSTEHQQVVPVSVSQALNILDQGELRHAPTIIALSVCRNLLQKTGRPKGEFE